MVTIHRECGFRVVVYPGDREHGPPHVHVFNAEGEVKVSLGDADTAPAIERVAGMRLQDAACALRMVEERQEFFLARWRVYHGA
ncbi:MAG TPA: DUF4160 domain-containing protein [Longimicrobiaceae bacterium]|nr:DUF4160 domain-containing protein [Longimicrobiaceae bacterium]